MGTIQIRKIKHNPFVSSLAILCVYLCVFIGILFRVCWFFFSLSGCTGGGSADRIQRLRKEYHQARREGLAFYEDDEGRTQLSDYDQRWVGPQRDPKCSCNMQS